MIFEFLHSVHVRADDSSD